MEMGLNYIEVNLSIRLNGDAYIVNTHTHTHTFTSPHCKRHTDTCIHTHKQPVTSVHSQYGSFGTNENKLPVTVFLFCWNQNKPIGGFEIQLIKKRPPQGSLLDRFKGVLCQLV